MTIARMAALAKHLNTSLDLIEEADEEFLFEISPRHEKRGNSPKYFLHAAQDIHRQLAPHDKPTWQELLASAAEVESALVLASAVLPSEAALKLRQRYTRYGLQPPETFDPEQLKEEAKLIGQMKRRATWMGSFPPGHLAYERLKSLMPIPQDDPHKYINALYHLLDNPPDCDDWHVKALRYSFNTNQPYPDTRQTYPTNSGEYLVLTDEEANDRASAYILDSLWVFSPEFMASFTGLPRRLFESLQTQYEDANEALYDLIKPHGEAEFVEAAFKADGRGPFLANYDREEVEIWPREFFWLAATMLAEAEDLDPPTTAEAAQEFLETYLDQDDPANWDLILGNPLYIYRTN